MGEVAQRLDITVSAGEQTYTLQGVKDLINAGIRMVQPDIVKMGGITGMMQCSALAHAHGVEFVPHQTQPSVGHLANLHLLSTVMHLAKPVELADNWERAGGVFTDPGGPVEGLFTVPTAPGLGMAFDAAEFQRRIVPLAI
jgi:D-galactarolactone cycloisomerase